MAYCRFGESESDVYAYASGNRDGVPCWVVHYGNSQWQECCSLQEFLDTLLELTDEGHKVPDYAINRVREELAEEN